MELTVLGAYGPFPKSGTGATSGYLLKDGDDVIALDMGAGVLARLIEATDISKLKNIFISHLHYDHTSDLLPFRYLLDKLGTKINVYTRRQDSEWFKILFDHPLFNVLDVDESASYEVGKLSLTFLPMIHPVPSDAVIIRGEKTFCYSGDTVMNENVEKCFESSDCILLDCSKPDGFGGPHMNIAQAKELALKYPEVKVIVTHHSENFDPLPEIDGIPNMISAEEGKTYTI